MKTSKVRFYVTISIVKIATKILKLLGRNATHLPGWMANKLCPDFLGHLEKPERLVYITGTNGKTTVSNLTAEVLKDNGYDFINNASGSNVSEGVISALLSKSSFFGKSKCKLAILEVDERYSPLIYPYMPPDYLLCTNLFRDSYKRNAHAEFISSVLNSQIPKHTKLILNGEDLISNHLAMGNERCYFGIRCPDGHSSSDNIIKDISFEGEACAISISSTSIMIKNLIGKTKEEALNYIKEFYKMTNGEPFDKELLKEAIVYEEISKQGNRKVCANLPLKGMEKAILESLK